LSFRINAVQRAEDAAALQLGDQLPDGQAASSAQTVADPALATRARCSCRDGAYLSKCRR